MSGFSGFNLPTVAVLDTDPKAAKRTAWSKGIPLLKLPTVASPAVSGGSGYLSLNGGLVRRRAPDKSRV